MWSIVITAIIGALKAILGLGGKPAEPSAVDLAASDAAAQEQLSQERTANDILTEGAQARADADARQLRHDDGPSDGVNTDPDAAVNSSPDAHFRD